MYLIYNCMDLLHITYYGYIFNNNTNNIFYKFMYLLNTV